MQPESTTALAPTPIRKPPKEALAQLEKVVVEGNLASLSEGERIAYYARVCESLGLNPLTRPFEYIPLNGKLTLYARKDATDQLRHINGIRITGVERTYDAENALQVVTAHAADRWGGEDSSIGVVSVKNLSGEALANALMKAETKAKRRVTLSIAGLGWLDETEAEDRRAFEVAPRSALKSAIASRTAALTGGTEQPEQHGTSETATPAASATPSDGSPANSAAPTEQPAVTPAVVEDTRTSASGEAAPARVAASPTQAKPRRRTAAPKQAGDDGYWRARAHAVAEERGLDPDAVKRIAGDVLGYLGDWSRKDMVEADWEQVAAALLAAPVTVDDEEISTYAGTAAVAAGIGVGEADPWPAIDKVASDLMGSPAEQLTPAEWLELGLRWQAKGEPRDA